jgi:hypothetical protein
MSEVVYARVPDSLKQALETHRSARGLTLTRAVVELLDHGLEAIADERSIAELERKLADCTSEIEQMRARLKQAELRLQAAREREQLIASTYTALAARARHKLAVCPRCRKPVRGRDLLVSGHCPNPDCAMALTSLLTPTPRAGLDPNEYLALLGALGVLVGLALATADASAT